MEKLKPRFIDYLKLNIWLHRFNIRKWFVHVLLPAFLGIYFWQVLHQDTGQIDIASTLIIIGMAMVMFLGWPYSIIKSSELASQQSTTIEFGFDRAGFTMITNEVTSEVKWSVVKKITYTKSAIYLWLSKEDLILLPKRDIKNLDELQKTLKQAVSK